MDSFKVMTNNYFVICLLILIITAGITLQPTVRARWDNSYRSKLINNFIGSINSSDILNSQEFWLFRERYSPGHFTYNDQYVDLFQTFRIIGKNESDQTDLLYYHSPLIASTESISLNPDYLNEVANKIHTSKIIAQSSDLLLYKEVIDESEEQFHLYFIKPIDDMMQTIGFFDYLPQEREILEGMYWVHYSKILNQ